MCPLLRKWLPVFVLHTRGVPSGSSAPRPRSDSMEKHIATSGLPETTQGILLRRVKRSIMKTTRWRRMLKSLSPHGTDSPTKYTCARPAQGSRSADIKFMKPAHKLGPTLRLHVSPDRLQISLPKVTTSLCARQVYGRMGGFPTPGRPRGSGKCW